MKLYKSNTSEFLELSIMDAGNETPSSQTLEVIPETARHMCFHEFVRVAPLDLAIVFSKNVPPLRITSCSSLENSNVFIYPHENINTLLFPLVPAAKSKMGLLYREILGEIENQLQMVKSLGCFNRGSWNYPLNS